MTHYIDQALDVLKGKGFRITKPRRLVVELLDSSERALSAYEIKALLDDKGESVDIASIYRIIDCLEETHLIHRVLTTGKLKKCQLEHETECHLPQAEHCHHLLICSQCGSIEEVHCPGTEDLVEKLETIAQFRVQGHHMEFMGICVRCDHPA